jgi:hypothetical protein
MTRYFTTYWTAVPWDGNAYEQVDHAAGNDFASHGIDVGDHVYVVHYAAREVFIGARLIVGSVATKREAAAALDLGEDEIWDGRDHVLADPDRVQRLDPNRVIPRETLKDLSFLRADGTETGLKFDADGAANQQTLRGVRELLPSSASLLDALVEWNVTPRPSQVLTMLLSRGPCLGECPVYTLALVADGFAAWEGGSFAARHGTHFGEVGADAFADLASHAVSGGFFTLEGEYPPAGTDLPDYEVVVGTGARDKVVRAWGGSEPEPFRDLAGRLDQVAESIEWQALESDGPVPSRV